MKQLLLFLACALLFELSAQIENIHLYRPKNLKFEGGCKIENGTLVCEKPIYKNSIKCSVGQRLSCHKTKAGETFCNCLPIVSIFKTTNKTTNCPNGTVYRCNRVRRGNAYVNDCSCTRLRVFDVIKNITQTWKELVKNFSKNNN